MCFDIMPRVYFTTANQSILNSMPRAERKSSAAGGWGNLPVHKYHDMSFVFTAAD